MRNLGMAIVILAMLTGLAGCAFSDPRISGSPPPLPTPIESTESTEQAVTVDFEQSASKLQVGWAAVSGLAILDPDQTSWSRIANTLKAQWLVLVGPDPYHRVAATDTDIGQPVTPAGIQPGLAVADTALIAARDDALEHGYASTGLPAGFWASLAAGVEQARRGLTEPYKKPIPTNPQVTMMVTTEALAVSGLLACYDEAGFALEAAVGYLDKDSSTRTQLEKTLAWLETSRDQLIAIAIGMGIDRPQTPGIYQLPSGRDKASSLALLTQAATSLAQAAGVWVVSASDTTQASEFLLNLSTMASWAGLSTAIWPGWPD